MLVSIVRRVMFLAVLGLTATSSYAQRQAPRVPPELELQIIDPGVDPRGNPTALLRPRGKQLEVDIPPTIIVHRYYYTGDRWFQGPVLQGGPVIVVANHPYTGRRCYVPLSLLPGAPVIRYHKNTIEYDYGDRGIVIHFPKNKPPEVSFRNGEKWSRRVGKLVHAEQMKQAWQNSSQRFRQHWQESKLALRGLTATVGDVAQGVLLPVRNALEMLPLGKPLLGTDWRQRLAERGAQQELIRAERAREQLRSREVTIPRFR